MGYANKSQLYFYFYSLHFQSILLFSLDQDIKQSACFNNTVNMLTVLYLNDKSKVFLSFLVNRSLMY